MSLFKIIIFTFLLVSPSYAQNQQGSGKSKAGPRNFSDYHFHKIEDKNVDGVQKLHLDTKNLDIYVVIRNDGHLLGLPVVVEIRPDCETKGVDWKNLEAVDSQSFCEVDIKSLKINSKSKNISLKVKSTSSADYNIQSATQSVQPQPRCESSFKEFQFPIADICSSFSQ